jgi:hypothetical protein
MTEAKEMASAHIQWKGTEACLDFVCSCGAQGHFDGFFAYALRCSNCGRIYELPDTLLIVEVAHTERNVVDIIAGADQ